MAVSLLRTTNPQPQSYNNNLAAIIANGEMDIDMDIDLGPIDIPEASDISVCSTSANRRSRAKAHLRPEPSGAGDKYIFT